MSTIKKGLYIKKNVDEKRSCALLEKHTRQLPFPVSFMVTTNCFFALECAQHTYFDFIIGENDFDDFNLLDMKKVLRTVGNRTPLILLESSDNSMPEIHGEFYNVLEEPFSASDLCNLIESVVENPSRNRAAPVNRIAQVSASTVDVDNTTAASAITSVGDAGVFKRASRQSHLDVIDEELPTTFDTQITFGLEGAYSVLPPTVEEAVEMEEMQTINALSNLSRPSTNLPSDTTSHSIRNVFHNERASAVSSRVNVNCVGASSRDAGGKLDAIQGVFAAKGSGNGGRRNATVGEHASRISGLLERMGSDFLHCYPSTSAMHSGSLRIDEAGEALPNFHDIRQLHTDFDFGQQQKTQSVKKRSIDRAT